MAPIETSNSPEMKRIRIALSTLAAVVLVTAPGARAHTPITTKYQFHRDVLPILRTRCAPCHAPSGPAPMSLLTHSDTRPWAVSIKEQVLERRMPPWFAEDGYEPLAGARSLSAREIDVLMDWASGGAPEGSRAEAAGAPLPAAADATPVDPELALPLPEVSLGESARRRRVTANVALETEQDRWLRAWRITPTRPRLLRAATVYLDERRADRFLGSWIAGQDAWRYPAGSAARLPRAARLVVDLFYEMPWNLRDQEAADRASLDLWFADDSPALEIRAAPLREGSLQLPAAATALVAVFPGADGRPFRLERRVDGVTRRLLEVHRAPVSWPLTYIFEEPLNVSPAPAVIFAASSAGAEGPGGSVLYAARVD